MKLKINASDKSISREPSEKSFGKKSQKSFGNKSEKIKKVLFKK